MNTHESDDAEAESSVSGATSGYEVFNPDYSVGVACDRHGMIIGIHLGDEVWENTDAWLSNEILKVAKLARMKSQVGRRAELMTTNKGAHLAGRLRLPMENDYKLSERSEFGGD
ncbi:hypothetical protein [Nocardia carnea]|uniref:hypothetical protein n=1 Tax=Nocardia carnea TaxID=37328 RepID=UPI0024560F25|nr:hypothetical protein [Nocardia carnea]